MYRSVQIWFQNTRNRKKRLANFLNNCDPIAVDYSNEYSQTTTPKDEYSNYSQEALGTPTNVIKSQNYNEPTPPAPKTADVPNKDNPPFVNQPTASVPDLPIGTTATRSAEEKQDKVDPQQQEKRRPTIIKTMVESKLISKENNMQRVTDDEEENTSAKKD